MFFFHTAAQKSRTVPVLAQLTQLVNATEVQHSFFGMPAFYIQHLLPSNVPFVTARHSQQVKPVLADRVLGKPYSSNPSATQQLAACPQLHLCSPSQPRELGLIYKTMKDDTRNAGKEFFFSLKSLEKHTQIPGVIIVSDGGIAKQMDEIYKQLGIKTPIAYVEQTTQGISLVRPYVSELSGPVISVAESAAKKEIEAMIIARNLSKASATLLCAPTPPKIGVIGASGAIGKSLVNALYAKLVALYPEAQPNLYAYNLLTREIEGVQWLDNLTDLLSAADIIFSATGNDVTRELSHEEVRKLINSETKKTLVNLASADEFEDLLKHIHAVDPTRKHRVTDDLTCGSLHLMSGGMPHNLALAIEQPEKFDHPEDFALTRGLMYAAMIQAASLLHFNLVEPELYQLNAHLQQFVLHQVKDSIIRRHPDLAEPIESLSGVEALTQRSQGKVVPDVVDEMLRAAASSMLHSKNSATSNRSPLMA
jgi:hypothetical protein